MPESVPTLFVAAVSQISSITCPQQILLLGGRSETAQLFQNPCPDLRNMIPAEQLAMSSRGSPSTPLTGCVERGLGLVRQLRPAGALAAHNDILPFELTCSSD